MSELIRLKAPAAPGNGATVPLINTTYMADGGTPVQGPGTGNTRDWIKDNAIDRIIISFFITAQASAAAGFKCYSYDRVNAAWRQIPVNNAGTITVGGVTIGITATSDRNTFDILVDYLDEFAAEFTAGATAPTIWDVTVSAVSGDRNPGI